MAKIPTQMLKYQNWMKKNSLGKKVQLSRKFKLLRLRVGGLCDATQCHLLTYRMLIVDIDLAHIPVTLRLATVLITAEVPYSIDRHTMFVMNQ